MEALFSLKKIDQAKKLAQESLASILDVHFYKLLKDMLANMENESTTASAGSEIPAILSSKQELLLPPNLLEATKTRESLGLLKAGSEDEFDDVLGEEEEEEEEEEEKQQQNRENGGAKKSVLLSSSSSTFKVPKKIDENLLAKASEKGVIGGAGDSAVDQQIGSYLSLTLYSISPLSLSLLPPINLNSRSIQRSDTCTSTLRSSIRQFPISTASPPSTRTFPGSTWEGAPPTPCRGTWTRRSRT